MLQGYRNLQLRLTRFSLALVLCFSPFLPELVDNSLGGPSAIGIM